MENKVELKFRLKRLMMYNQELKREIDKLNKENATLKIELKWCKEN